MFFCDTLKSRWVLTPSVVSIRNVPGLDLLETLNLVGGVLSRAVRSPCFKEMSRYQRHEVYESNVYGQRRREW